MATWQQHCWISVWQRVAAVSNATMFVCLCTCSFLGQMALVSLSNHESCCHGSRFIIKPSDLYSRSVQWLTAKEKLTLYCFVGVDSKGVKICHGPCFRRIHNMNIHEPWETARGFELDRLHALSSALPKFVHGWKPCRWPSKCLYWVARQCRLMWILLKVFISWGRPAGLMYFLTRGVGSIDSLDIPKGSLAASQQLNARENRTTWAF